MNIETALLKAGLSQRETKLYTTLISYGELTANELAKITNIIRTNCYDVLNDLTTKGIVAYSIRNNKKYFHATEPEKIIDYLETRKKDLEELRDDFEKIIPTIKTPQNRFNKPIIEVYEGKEGMKTILAMSVRESLKTKKEILGISVQQEKCRKLTEIYHTRWYNEREKYKIKSRYVMSSEEKIIPVKYTKFKILPKEAKNPNEVFIFGDITAQFFFVGDLFTAILIKNEDITNKYRDYFEFLWKVLD